MTGAAPPGRIATIYPRGRVPPRAWHQRLSAARGGGDCCEGVRVSRGADRKNRGPARGRARAHGCPRFGRVRLLGLFPSDFSGERDVPRGGVLRVRGFGAGHPPPDICCVQTHSVIPHRSLVGWVPVGLVGRFRGRAPDPQPDCRTCRTIPGGVLVDYRGPGVILSDLSDDSRGW